MTPHGRWMVLGVLLTGSAAPAWAAPPPREADGKSGAAAPESPVDAQDVELRARHVTSWVSPSGEAVMLFRGDFRLRIGEFRAGSRDGVVWVRTGGPAADGPPAHALTVYLEGGVSIVHLDGSRTTSERFLVSRSTRGKLVRTAQTQIDRDVSADGVFIRGEFARRGEKAPAADGGAAPVGGSEKATKKEGGGSVRTAPRRRIVLGPCNIEVRTRGEEIVAVLTGRRVPGARGPEPVRLLYGDLEMIADSMVLFSHRRLAEAGGGGPMRSADAPDIGEGVYLEGDVQINGDRYSLQAARVFYDFGNRAHSPDRAAGPEQAVLVDAVMRTYDEERRLPLYLRATEIFMQSRTDFAAENAVLTNDDFNPPHFHLGARRLQIWGLGAEKIKATGQSRLRGYFDAHDAAFNVLDVPILWLPRISAENDPRPEALKSIGWGHSSRLGYFGRSEWFLWKLLGMDKPPSPGMEGILRLDGYGDRGPFIGGDLDWQQERSFGFFRGEYLHDDGLDKLSNFLGKSVPSTDERGRILVRHRQFIDEHPEFGLSRGWELSLELAYVSDRAYLPEFHRREFRDDKEQESLLLLKKRGILDRDNWAAWLHVQPQLNRFFSEVERLPEAGILGVGEPIGPFSLYSENRGGSLILRTGGYIDPLTQSPPAAGAPTPVESNPIVRGFTRQEATLPFAMGPARFQFYGAGRVGVYTDPFFDDGDIGVQRFGVVGLRGLMQFWRVYPDVGSRLLDLHRLRHVIKPEFNVWVAGTNVQPEQMLVFDRDIEGTGAQNGVQLALRNLLQTKRGGPDRLRTVDWMWLDCEAGFYARQHYGFDEGLNRFADPVNGNYAFINHPDGIGGIFRGENVWYRPENSRPRDHARVDFGWRATEAVQIAADAHWDLDNRPLPLVAMTRTVAGALVIAPEPAGRAAPDTWGIGIVSDMSPQSRVFFGYRRISPLDADTLTGGFSYSISEAYSAAFLMQYDIGRNQIIRNRIELSRRLPRWVVTGRFDFDQVRDDIGFSIALEPDLGPRRR